MPLKTDHVKNVHRLLVICLYCLMAAGNIYAMFLFWPNRLPCFKTKRKKLTWDSEPLKPGEQATSLPFVSFLSTSHTQWNGYEPVRKYIMHRIPLIHFNVLGSLDSCYENTCSGSRYDPAVWELTHVNSVFPFWQDIWISPLLARKAACSAAAH